MVICSAKQVTLFCHYLLIWVTCTLCPSEGLHIQYTHGDLDHLVPIQMCSISEGCHSNVKVVHKGNPQKYLFLDLVYFCPCVASPLWPSTSSIRHCCRVWLCDSWCSQKCAAHWLSSHNAAQSKDKINQSPPLLSACDQTPLPCLLTSFMDYP